MVTKREKITKYIKQQLFKVFCASCNCKMTHLIDAVLSNISLKFKIGQLEIMACECHVRFNFASVAVSLILMQQNVLS